MALAIVINNDTVVISIHQSINQSVNQSIKAHLYSATDRERSTGAHLSNTCNRLQYFS